MSTSMENKSIEIRRINDDNGQYIFEFRKLLQGDNLLKHLKCDDAYLYRFLAAVDYDITNAFQRIKNFYELLSENPKWFSMGGLIDKRRLIQKDISIILNKHDKEGRPIYLLKLDKINPFTMDFVKDLVILQDLCCEGIFINNMDISMKGLCIIVDVANIPLNVIKWATPHIIKTSIKRIYSMPIKDFRYHIVNTTTFLNIIMQLVWPFLPQHIKEQIKFHLFDYKSLHQHIDKDSLPKEYGGTQKINTTELRRTLLDCENKIAHNFQVNRRLFLDAITN
ncbi:clavesin-1-like [Diorhabda carinulata]|uniref:clavesin-1-like n=1 Tax=Diorhabda carinulata TaxID=1163345 RepID=UPI0025A0B0AC|nr:clavesin-1-like [Diorhabda carinulata]